MIGASVSKARIVDIKQADGVPGLYDVFLEDGSVFADLTTHQTQSLVDRNGVVHPWEQSGDKNA